MAPLPAGQPGLRLPGDHAGARAPASRFLTGTPSRRLALAWLAFAACVALGEAIDANVQGIGAVPPVIHVGAAALLLFAVCGYGPAALLLPAALRRHLGLYVLPVGAACSTLALTVLGLLHVPLALSIAVVLAAGGGLAVMALARRRATPLAPPGGRVVHLDVPLALAALVAAMCLLPMFRAGFATVQGQNGDAVLAVGTAELLRHAPPTAVRPELPLDEVPVVWRSKLPIYYGLAATSDLAGKDPIAAFSIVAAIAMGLAMLGVFLLAVDGLGAPLAAGLAALFVVGLDRIVVYVAIHPYFNQTWALFTLPFVLLFGSQLVREPAAGTAGLAALFTALALFTYPLLLPFPALFLAVLLWRRRRELDWRRLPRPRPWLVALVALPAVPVVAVLVRGVVEKIVPAIDALRPGGDLSGWSGPALPYLPFARFLGTEGHAVTGLAVLVFAVLAVRAIRGDAMRALAITLAGALLASIYLRARGQAELFYFKDLGFAGPLVVMLAIVGVVTRLPRIAAGAAIALLCVVLAAGTRREVSQTFEQVPRDLLALQTWDRELPPNETIRIDVPPSGWQLWTWYLLPRHRVNARAPLSADFFPHPPAGRRADLVVVQAGQRRPRDAVGVPLRANSQVVLYRLKPGLPGPDTATRSLIFPITQIDL